MGNINSWKKGTLSGKHGTSLFEYSMRTIDGEEMSMSKFREFKALLVVNVASMCGLTESQFGGLKLLSASINEKAGPGKFQVLTVPCSQFLKQEHSDPQKTKDAFKKFDVDYPLFEKIVVNGPEAHPLFQFLKFNSPELYSVSGDKITLKAIEWNYGKFLVDSEGHVVKYYGPRVSPMDLESDIIQVINGELKGRVTEIPDDVEHIKADEL